MYRRLCCSIDFSGKFAKDQDHIDCGSVRFESAFRIIYFKTVLLLILTVFWEQPTGSDYKEKYNYKNKRQMGKNQTIYG